MSQGTLGRGSIEGRPRAEIDKRGELEGRLAGGIAAVRAIVAPLNQELEDWALMLLDMIRTGETCYADAVHVASRSGETAPLMKQLTGLRILIEQAELDSLTTVPSN